MGGHGHGDDDGHGSGHAAAVGLRERRHRLATAREALGVIARLTDEQLDAVPAHGRFRFCDGQRTLEQVIAGLLKHQARQLDFVRTAVEKPVPQP
jgi:hypothetical protein